MAALYRVVFQNRTKQPAEDELLRNLKCYLEHVDVKWLRGQVAIARHGGRCAGPLGAAMSSRLIRFALRVVIGITLCWFVAAVLICLKGITSPRGDADIALVLGNTLEDDGTPKPILAARLNTALQCHREGQCPMLFVSGSIEDPGHNEAASMRTWLIDHGVAQDDIVVDEHGDNTLASARNAIAFMRKHGMKRVMLVTQCYHLPRAKLAIERAGAPVVYGDYPHRFRAMDAYWSWREVPAYAFYFVRLGLNPDARPMSVKPVLFLRNLLSKVG